MTVNLKLGSGSFTYEVSPEWEKLPDEYSWTDAAGVAVDSQDRVYVFNRGEHPIIIFDSDGNFLRVLTMSVPYPSDYQPAFNAVNPGRRVAPATQPWMNHELAPQSPSCCVFIKPSLCGGQDPPDL